MNSFKAVIFDMDGLLVDSEIVWHVAEKELFEDRGIAYTPEVRAQIIGLRLDAMFTRLKSLYTLEESIADLSADLIARMLHLIPKNVKAQPGAPELVQYVAKKGIPTGIASSSPMSIIDAVVNHMGWQEIFVLRCSADDDAHGKPAPDVYLRAARLLKVDPSSCLALEDSPNGARAAVAAGMTCYAVPDHSHSQIDVFADITPHIFPDLHAVLRNLQ